MGRAKLSLFRKQEETCSVCMVMTDSHSVLTLRTGDRDREPDTRLWCTVQCLQTDPGEWLVAGSPAQLSLQESKVPSPGRNQLLVFLKPLKPLLLLNRLVCLTAVVLSTSEFSGRSLEKITYDHEHKRSYYFRKYTGPLKLNHRPRNG